ncbi:MAG: YHS domain-containing (seleno)protein [Geminicoccaceae bacterium]
MFRRSALATVVLLASASMAMAGPQYVDETGYALSGYDPVAYFTLEQPPLGEAQPHAVPGRADITADWNGATWAFATAENRDKFLADPEAYAPAYDGHCAYGVAKGGKVPANPNLWRIVEGQLYVNITPTVQGFWTADVDGNIEAAETNWPGIEGDAASGKSWTSMDDTAGTYETLAPIGG